MSLVDVFVILLLSKLYVFNLVAITCFIMNIQTLLPYSNLDTFSSKAI